jgi:hypothetical protein
MGWLIPIAAMVALALLHSSPALAFSSREAGLVVEVLEDLAEARGESGRLFSAKLARGV